jgi:hypothetical protein
MTVPPVPAIDVHTHLFPARLAAAVRRALGDMYGWSFDLPDSPEAFAAFARARGTERFCVLPYAHKPGMARDLNAWIADTCAALEGAIGFACVHPDDDDPVAILDDAFERGLRGLKLHHQVQQVAPDDARLDRIYAHMIERDMPILAHAGKGPTDNGLVGLDRFRAALDRHPALRACVAHLGWPEQPGFVALTRAYPNLYLDTSGMGNSSLAAIGIEDSTDRILFGTDAPNIAFEYDLTISRILDLPLTEAQQRAIFRDNAIAFLGL